MSFKYVMLRLYFIPQLFYISIMLKVANNSTILTKLITTTTPFIPPIPELISYHRFTHQLRDFSRQISSHNIALLLIFTLSSMHGFHDTRDSRGHTKINCKHYSRGYTKINCKINIWIFVGTLLIRP